MRDNKKEGVVDSMTQMAEKQWERVLYYVAIMSLLLTPWSMSGA